MKKTLMVIAIIIVNAVAYLLFLLPDFLPEKEVVYIAVAGPMGNARGDAMRKGIELYKDKINSQGGIDGKEIELLFYDDKDEPAVAEQIANQIEAENKALLVIGHYRNAPSIAAGDIYKRNEIPAITGSATDESVTLGNDWYFRVIPNTRMEAGFIANYINKSLKKKTATIIFTNDNYGISLVENFESTAKSRGIKIKKLAWDNDKNPDEQLKTILNELKASDNTEIIFLATHSSEGLKIVTTLKDKGIRFPIIGCYAFARSFFIEAKKYPREFEEPGYYSNGIYFTTPFMAAIGGAEAYKFQQEFLKKYHEPSDEISICYYDAMQVAVQAIKKADIQGKNHIRADRRKIRDMLTQFYNEETAVRGAAGNIYFDENGEVKRPYAVGVYYKHKTLPAPSQYRQLINAGYINYNNVIRYIMDGELIIVDRIFMNNVRIVYTGIEIIRIDSPVINRSECMVEFDLWFRYSGKFDDTNIEFENSISPIKLDKPIREETKNNITIRKYRVKANFKCDFNLYMYPFDRQLIPIHFHHSNHITEELIYVPDMFSLSESFNGKIASGWNVNKIFFYQDVMLRNSSLGNPKFFDPSYSIAYSRFNTDIRIQRNASVLILKYGLPIVAVFMMLSYLIFFIPADRLRLRIIILMAALTVMIASHLMYSSVLLAEYLTIFDYVFMGGYVLIALSAFTVVLRKKNVKPGLWILPMKSEKSDAG